MYVSTQSNIYFKYFLYYIIIYICVRVFLFFDICIISKK